MKRTSKSRWHQKEDNLKKKKTSKRRQPQNEDIFRKKKLKIKWLSLNYQIKPAKPNLPIHQTKPTKQNKTYQTKPTKPFLPNKTYQIKPTEPNLPNKTYHTKPTKQNLLNQSFQTSYQSKENKVNKDTIRAWQVKACPELAKAQLQLVSNFFS